jgi:hypothetical protein
MLLLDHHALLILLQYCIARLVINFQKESVAKKMSARHRTIEIFLVETVIQQ